MTAAEIVRIIGPEFKDVSDEVLAQYVQIFRPMVSRNRFGDLYNQGLAYLICHPLKIAGYGENPLGSLGAIGAAGFGISSVSEGGSSISFAATQSSNLTSDAELGLTTYGVQYLNIRRSVIVPIYVSGEDPEPVASYNEADYSLVPVASATKLGGVKVRPGSGLKLSDDGELSIDPVTPEQMESLVEDTGDG